MGKTSSPKKAWMPETKLEVKMVEAMQRREAEGSNIKSFNSVILKFPKIDESLRNCKAIFEQFGRCPVPCYLLFLAGIIHLAVSKHKFESFKIKHLNTVAKRHMEFKHQFLPKSCFGM